MYAIVVWLNEDTTVPSVIGPYETDLVFDDANLLRSQCHKIQVTNCTNPESAKILDLLSSHS